MTEDFCYFWNLWSSRVGGQLLLYSVHPFILNPGPDPLPTTRGRVDPDLPYHVDHPGGEGSSGPCLPALILNSFPAPTTQFWNIAGGWLQPRGRGCPTTTLCNRLLTSTQPSPSTWSWPMLATLAQHFPSFKCRLLPKPHQCRCIRHIFHQTPFATQPQPQTTSQYFGTNEPP